MAEHAETAHRAQHGFDADYWEEHWREAHGSPGTGGSRGPNPQLVRETTGLTPGTALDAGCGEGEEALWLAAQGWQVTAADISAEALARAADRATDTGVADAVQWVQADLTVWEPGTRFDLVATSYAHPAMPQLAFYDRIADWVAPGGTLLVVGHLHDEASAGHDHHPPDEASVTLSDITARLDAATWEVVTTDERSRTVARHGDHQSTLRDVVVRAVRRG